MLSLQNYVMFSLLNQNHRHLKKWDSCKDTLTTSLHLGTSHLHLFNFIYRWYIVDIFLANNYKYWSHIDLLHFPTPLSPQMGREARDQKIQRTSWWMERGRNIGQTALMFLRAECRPCKQCWWTVIVSKYLIFYKSTCTDSCTTSAFWAPFISPVIVSIIHFRKMHYESLGKCCNCGKQYPEGQDSFCLHLPRTMIFNHEWLVTR